MNYRLPAAEPTPNTRVLPLTLVLGYHVKDEHVKGVAQEVAQDVTQGAAQDVTQGVLGAAEDGGVKVLIVARVIFQR